MKSMRQELIWIPLGEDVGGRVTKVPPIPYDGPEPRLLWTLYRDCNPNEKPKLPIDPIHLSGAFLEDRIHDWRVRDGKLYYYSRASGGGTWALLEFDKGEDDG